jgi:hypothetical protein
MGALTGAIIGGIQSLFQDLVQTSAKYTPLNELRGRLQELEAELTSKNTAT